MLLPPTDARPDAYRRGLAEKRGGRGGSPRRLFNPFEASHGRSTAKREGTFKRTARRIDSQKPSLCYRRRRGGMMGLRRTEEDGDEAHAHPGLSRRGQGATREMPRKKEGGGGGRRRRKRSRSSEGRPRVKAEQASLRRGRRKAALCPGGGGR